MTFTTLTQLREYILEHIVPNNQGLIDASKMQDILIGLIDLTSNTLTAPLKVNLGTGGQVGGISTNDEFEAGTSFEEILSLLFTKVVHPSYNQPQAVLTDNIGIYTHEIGTIISPQLVLTFNQNDAGSLISQNIRRDGASISSSSPYTDTNRQLVGTPVIYDGSVVFNQGPCKLNNLEQIDCVGRVVGGMVVSNQIIFNSYRKAFYGTSIDPVTTSEHVRSLDNSLINPIVGSTFTINVPAGSRRVVFAYPNTLQDPSSIAFFELGGLEVKDNFVKTIVSVAGNNGYSPIDYKVFTFEPVEPFFETSNFTITI